MPSARPILLVEDDLFDVMAMRRVLREFQMTNELVHVENGEEALAYLRDGQYPRPCLVLLDLNMPRMNGFEFLEILKADETLKDLPVMMVTTSPEHQDMRRSFELGVVAYIVKCPNYAEFREDMRVIEDYAIETRPQEGLKTGGR